MATAEMRVRIVPNNEPSDRITLDISGTAITVAAWDLAQLLVEKMTSGSALRRDRDAPAPSIGSAWPGQGGIYVGIARGREGASDYHLVVAMDERTGIAWDDAMSWALGLEADGHHDFELPTRPEQALLYANVKELFAGTYYWSATQYAGDAGSAWCQYFSHGSQGSYHKLSELRARAVRRVPIQ